MRHTVEILVEFETPLAPPSNLALRDEYERQLASRFRDMLFQIRGGPMDVQIQVRGVVVGKVNP